MPVSGLVITLAAPDAPLAAAWRDDPRVTLGQRDGVRLPVVTDTDGAAADRRLHATVHADPAVIAVDIAFVHFDPDPGSPEEEPPWSTATAARS